MKGKVLDCVLAALLTGMLVLGLGEGLRYFRLSDGWALFVIEVGIISGVVLMVRHMKIEPPVERRRRKRRGPVPFHIGLARLHGEIGEIWQETRFTFLPWR